MRPLLLTDDLCAERFSAHAKQTNQQPMTTPNRISASISTEQVATLQSKISEVKDALPFLIDLSPEERHALPKMGDKSRAFVSRCVQIAQQDDSFLPKKFIVAEFAEDYALSEALEPIRQELAKLLELVEDTQLLAGSEAYLAALEVYHSAQRTGQGSGLDDIIDQVSQRFTRRRKEDKGPEMP